MAVRSKFMTVSGAALLALLAVGCTKAVNEEISHSGGIPKLFRAGSDPVTRTRMNGGVVIKSNANQAYTTDAVSAALVKSIAAKAGAQRAVFPLTTGGANVAICG